VNLVNLARLTEKIVSYNPEFNKGLLEKAYTLARQAHRGQKRNSGEDFIQHPLAVACILAGLELDTMTIAAGLLHDVVEDTNVTLVDLEKGFGPELALLVDGVTKLSRIEYKSKEEQQVENLRKMFLAMAKDIRVIMIKLADRLHNMRTLKHQTPTKQREVAEETLEIFAPLAHRLGIFKIKWELEDLAFRYLEPEKYYDLVERIAMKRQQREEYINQIVTTLSERLAAVGIKAEIAGRPKHFYSIYEKMFNQGKDLSEIYDLIAIRVVVDSVRDCYGALGTIHTLWKPIPGRFKDYIAMPKPNMYQSLHTTLMGPQGEPFEIQIRTKEMHRTAEYGIAAHWKYKEGKAGDKEFEKKLSWLRQLLEWEHDLRDAREFMESLKIDLFSDTVFVFTPKGDVVELPAGSVPIDFAYRVHTEVGHRCVGAKVNGRIVTLDYQLNNGDIVEILTAKQSNGPSRDWLNLVKTSQAKNRIRQWFKKEKREENIPRGRELLEREIKKLGLEVSELLKTERLAEAVKRFNLNGPDDLLASVGDGAITPQQVVSRLKEDYRKDRKGEEEALLEAAEIKPRPGAEKSSAGVRVHGIGNLMVRLSHCCNPLPGDKIIGYITRGRGVSIHRADCRNIVYFNREEAERIIDVSWDQPDDASYQVEIEVTAVDRPRITADVMNAIADTKTNINAVNARSGKNRRTIIDLTVEIRSLEHLNAVLQKVKRLGDVIDVHRIVPT
jgi:guanosine-3',5'-bis(diphosphate) 3'-pyrophosphohydrolase